MPAHSKSKRRRILERIRRFASSPTLTKGDHTPPLESKTGKQTVSCVSLSSVSFTSGFRSPPPKPFSSELDSNVFGLQTGTDSTLELFVDCDDGSNSQEKAGPTWQSLPREIKIQIMAQLDPMELVRCCSVSHEFYQLCFEGQLWKTIDATNFYNRIPVDQLAPLIVTAGPYVRHLNLRGCIQLYQDWRVEAVANACRNLLSASLEGCRFERSVVHFIVMRNPQLVRLNLSGLSAVTNSTCKMLSQSCPRIEVVDVSFCTNADGRGLRRIVEGCRGLRELRACELAINDPGLMQVLYKRNTVERLHLSETTGITDEHIRLLVEGIEPEVDPFTNRSLAPPRKLVHLDLGKCTELTDTALRYLSGHVPNLEGLELGGIPSFTDAAFAALLPTVPKLAHLDVEECLELTDTTLFNLSRSPACKTLSHLQVSYCENIGDTGVMEVLRRCEKLGNLEMDNTRVSDLTIAEAVHIVHKRRPQGSQGTNGKNTVALRMVIYDCANITWTGIREVLTRNTEAVEREPQRQTGLIKLKCFYEHQNTVDEHTKLLLNGEIAKANAFESEWAEHMMAQEENWANGRRRRRGAGVVARAGLNGGGGFGAGLGRRSRSVCVVM